MKQKFKKSRSVLQTSDKKGEKERELCNKNKT